MVTVVLKYNNIVCTVYRKMDHFSELPDELILKIFGYLEHHELKSCLLVCQKWLRLGNDDSLWHEVRTTWHKILHNDQLLSSIAVQHPNLHSLVIVGNSSMRDSNPSSLLIPVTLDVWSLFDHLTRLTLYDCPKQLFHSAIPHILNGCQRTLTCFSCEGSSTLESEQFQLLFSNPSVQYRELSIAHCSLIGDLAVLQAQHNNSNFTTCLEKLELLNLDGVGTVERMTDTGMIALLTACPLLKSLTCDGEMMTDESSMCIQSLSRLEHLSISFCTELTDESLKCFSNLKNLTSLHLRKGNDFTNQGFEQLFDGLCSKNSSHDQCASSTTVSYSSDSSSSSVHATGIGKLRKLCLVECRLLRDSGLMKLAKSFPDIVHLDLSWCWNLSDIGLEAVARCCQQIETLRLVGLKNAMCVPVLGTSLPRLRCLDLEQTDLVDDEELRKLKETKPWIKIVDYYGEEVEYDKIANSETDQEFALPNDY